MSSEDPVDRLARGIGWTVLIVGGLIALGQIRSCGEAAVVGTFSWVESAAPEPFALFAGACLGGFACLILMLIVGGRSRWIRIPAAVLGAFLPQLVVVAKYGDTGKLGTVLGYVAILVWLKPWRDEALTSVTASSLASAEQLRQVGPIAVEPQRLEEERGEDTETDEDEEEEFLEPNLEHLRPIPHPSAPPSSAPARDIAWMCSFCGKKFSGKTPHWRTNQREDGYWRRGCEGCVGSASRSMGLDGPRLASKWDR